MTVMAPSRLASIMRRWSSCPSEVKGASSMMPALLTRTSVTAEFGLDPAGGRDEGVAVGDVGLDGDNAVAELVGQGLDAVRAAREQG